ncbi:hypothetical protein QM797_16475 [Rhodococcus sp. IEGM 1381]|uniref:hypothetical protein n=1 Tax=Rhodococcus sp. IEGM 1381 TaxID=3047085 RepID=UPI0024B79C80|nr:hypothetical protein [Rhodococcus sp. IEGM 1381]MDI9896322.1 hypothetical protein [Rhodococcus sp. IEGM 1381]
MDLTEADGVSRDSDFGLVWAKENLIWLVGLIPFVAAFLSVYTFSGGDRARLIASLDGLDVVTLVFASVVPVAPVIVFLTGSYFVLRDVDRGRWRGALWSAFITLAGSLLITRTSELATVAVGYPALILPFVLLHIFFRKRFSKPFPAEIILIVMASAFVLGGVNTDFVKWLPSEMIAIKAEAPRLGSVVKEQEDSITVIWDGAGVERIPIGDVAGRVICSTLDESRFVLETIRGATDPERTVACW